MGLTVDANISNTEDLFGRTVDDLQSNIAVGSDSVSGELNPITDYQSDDLIYYLALHASVPGADDADITVELIDTEE